MLTGSGSRGTLQMAMKSRSPVTATALSVEFTGSFFLMLALGLSGDPLAAGLLLIALLYLGKELSGAHYNPAVTLGFWAAGELPGRTLLAYLLFQTAGFLVGALLIYHLAGGVLIPVTGGYSPGAVEASVELLFAALFCMTYLVVFLKPALSKTALYGVIIAFCYAGILMAGQPVSGGVFNPALPAAWSLLELFLYGDVQPGALTYLLAPAAGGLIAGNIFTRIRKLEEHLPGEA